MATIPSTERRTKAKQKLTTAVLNLTTDRGDLQIPPSVFTLAGFREWAKADDFPEKVKVAFIDGEVYVDMANEEIFTHVAAKDEIVKRMAIAQSRNRILGGNASVTAALLRMKRQKVSNNPGGACIHHLGIAWNPGRVRLNTAERGRRDNTGDSGS